MGASNPLTMVLSAEKMKARRYWHVIYGTKGKNFQLRISYPTKLIFRNRGEVKVLPNKN